jgi:hypothetical protein
VEFAFGARLVPEGILPTVLHAAVASQTASAQVDELGHAIEVGAIQEIRGNASVSPGWDSCLAQNPAFQWSRCGYE